MPVYTISSRTTVTTGTALTPIAALRSSTANRTEIREIQLFNVTAPTTSGGVGLMRSTGQGTASASVTTPQPRDPSSSGDTAILETAWSAAPTVGAVGTVMKRWHHGTSIGNGIVWTYDLTSPLILPASNTATGSLVLVNLQATAAATYDLVIIYNV